MLKQILVENFYFAINRSISKISIVTIFGFVAKVSIIRKNFHYSEVWNVHPLGKIQKSNISIKSEAILPVHFGHNFGTSLSLIIF